MAACCRGAAPRLAAAGAAPCGAAAGSAAAGGPRSAWRSAGELDRASGLGEGARLYARAACRRWASRAGAGEARPPPPPGVPLVLHVNAAGAAAGDAAAGAPPAARAAASSAYWPWELPRGAGVLGGGVRLRARGLGAVPVLGRGDRAACRRFAQRRVRVVPYPVACGRRRRRACDRAALGVPADAVVTLVAFNLASSFERKNPLARHRRAPGGVRHPAGPGAAAAGRQPARTSPADFARLQQAAADAPNVRLRHADAAARGGAGADGGVRHRAVAASQRGVRPGAGRGDAAGGSRWWRRPGRARRTSWTRAAACRCRRGWCRPRDPRGVFDAAGAVWAEPDVAAAAAALRRLADDPAERRRLGAAGAAGGAGPARTGGAGRGGARPRTARAGLPLG